MRSPFVILALSALVYSVSGHCQQKPIQPPGHILSGGTVNNRPITSSAILSELNEELAKTTSPAAKADIYFWISRFYADRLKIDSALYFSNLVKQQSELVKYEKGLAKSALARSYALFFRNASEPEKLEQAITVFRQANDKLFLALSYRQKAKQYDANAQAKEVRANFHIALHYIRQVRDMREEQRILSELGRNFYLTYELDSAAFHLLKSLKLAEEFKDQGRIFSVSSLLGEVYVAIGDRPKAAIYLEYALQNRTQGTSLIMVRNCLSTYASCLMELERFGDADRILKEYEAINKKLGDAWGQIMALQFRGMYYYEQKKYSEALEYLQPAYSRVDEITRFSFDVKNIAYYLARTEIHLGKYDSAIRHMNHVKEICQRIKFGADLLDANLFLSQCFEKTGKLDSAYAYFKAYDAMKDSLATVDKEKAVVELTLRFETEKKEQQIKLLESQQVLSDLELRSKMNELERQQLLAAQNTQQLALLSQRNDIANLEAAGQKLKLENQQKEMSKKQDELALLAKENELQAALAAKESQRKNFAYIAIAAALVFSGYVYYRYTRNRQLSRKLSVSLTDLKAAQAQLIKTEKEKEAENIRVRISRDIHDEVGATLSGVALFSEIARERIKERRDEDAQVYLDHITVNSKEMVDKMSDIVWAINPDNDSFSRIIAKLQSYAFNLCAGKGISLHINIDPAIQQSFPSMQVKRNLYLFMKEAINNSVKYSGCKNLLLSLQYVAGRVKAEIKDDGKGFDDSNVREGNGLKNMKARAESLGADLKITSAAGKGTAVGLQFDFHLSGGQAAEV